MSESTNQSDENYEFMPEYTNDEIIEALKKKNGRPSKRTREIRELVENARKLQGLTKVLESGLLDQLLESQNLPGDNNGKSKNNSSNTKYEGFLAEILKSFGLSESLSDLLGNAGDGAISQSIQKYGPIISAIAGVLIGEWLAEDKVSFTQKDKYGKPLIDHYAQRKVRKDISKTAGYQSAVKNWQKAYDSLQKALVNTPPVPGARESIENQILILENKKPLPYVEEIQKVPVYKKVTWPPVLHTLVNILLLIFKVLDSLIAFIDKLAGLDPVKVVKQAAVTAVKTEQRINHDTGGFGGFPILNSDFTHTLMTTIMGIINPGTWKQ